MITLMQNEMMRKGRGREGEGVEIRRDGARAGEMTWAEVEHWPCWTSTWGVKPSRCIAQASRQWWCSCFRHKYHQHDKKGAWIQVTDCSVITEEMVKVKETKYIFSRSLSLSFSHTHTQFSCPITKLLSIPTFWKKSFRMLMRAHTHKHTHAHTYTCTHTHSKAYTHTHMHTHSKA